VLKVKLPVSEDDVLAQDALMHLGQGFELQEVANRGELRAFQAIRERIRGATVIHCRTTPLTACAYPCTAVATNDDKTKVGKTCLPASAGFA
jgi:hypothetical protein